MMPVAILCGGKGTRLAPLTDDTPKYLVDVAGKPFAFHQLALLKKHGYTDIVLLTGHFGRQIERVLGDGSYFGMSIRYCADGADPLGTDAAIQRAWPLLAPQCYVLYGDSYLECDYQAIERTFHTCHRDALVTTWRGEDFGLRAFRRWPAVSKDVYVMTLPWKEMGSHDGRNELHRYLSEGHHSDRAVDRALFSGSHRG